MSKVIEILFPVVEYISLIKRYIVQREKYSLQNKQHRIIPYLINFEKFSVFLTYLSITFLLVLSFFLSNLIHYKYVLISFVTLTAITLFFLYFKKKPKNYTLFYSSYYILIFFLLSFIPHHLYNIEKDFENDIVLILSVILLQSFRSGKYSAVPVIFIIFTIYFCENYDELLNFQKLGYLYLFLITWISGITIIFESILYYISLDYIELREKRDREKHELDLSRMVYNNFFPQFTGNELIKFNVWRSEQNQAGGDFYDLIELREKNLGLFFADISGHGVSSAIMAGALKMILKNRSYLEKINPEKLLTKLDKIFHKEYASHHASAIYLFLNFIEKKATIANAGHPPILYAPKGKKFKELITNGSILGYCLNDPIAQELLIPINQGDRFIVYTDGLTDFITKNNSVSIVDNMEDVVNNFYLMNGEELIENIPVYVNSLPDFQSFRDDIVISVIEIL